MKAGNGTADFLSLVVECYHIFLLSYRTAQTDQLRIRGDITHILEALIMPYFFDDILFHRHGTLYLSKGASAGQRGKNRGALPTSRPAHKYLAM